VSHTIGERPWRSSSQPTRLSLFSKCCKTTDLEIKQAQLQKKQPNTEHGEVSLQMKEHAYANKEDQI